MIILDSHDYVSIFCTLLALFWGDFKDIFKKVKKKTKNKVRKK